MNYLKLGVIVIKLEQGCLTIFLTLATYVAFEYVHSPHLKNA